MSTNFSGSKIKGILGICTLLILLTTLFLFGSCNNDKKVKLPDLEGITSELRVLRLEELLGQQADLQAFRTTYKELEVSDSALVSFYKKHLAGLPVFMQELESYPDSLYQHLYIPLDTTNLLETVAERHANWAQTQADIDLAYRLHHYYLDSEPLPPIFTYIAPFGYPVALSEEWLAVSLDMFMGSDWPEYQQVTGLFSYQFPRMTPEYLPVACMQAIVSDKMNPLPPNASVLDHMIHQGKQLYYLEQVLPRKAKHTLIGYTAAQTEWCDKYQQEIWGSLVTDGVLYSKKASDVQRITGEGPNTKGMGSNSPGRIGNWIGWQIVKAYMSRTGSTDIQALLDEQDAQKILESSRWKPAK